MTVNGGRSNLPPQPAPNWTPMSVCNTIKNDGIIIRTIAYNINIIPDNDLHIDAIESITQQTPQSYTTTTDITTVTTNGLSCSTPTTHTLTISDITSEDANSTICIFHIAIHHPTPV